MKQIGNCENCSEPVYDTEDYVEHEGVLYHRECFEEKE